jgi:hypothetical protein
MFVPKKDYDEEHIPWRNKSSRSQWRTLELSKDKINVDWLLLHRSVPFGGQRLHQFAKAGFGLELEDLREWKEQRTRRRTGGAMGSHRAAQNTKSNRALSRVGRPDTSFGLCGLTARSWRGQKSLTRGWVQEGLPSRCV